MGANSGQLLKQSTARTRMVNLGATSLTPTVTISKNGGAFAALGGSIAEVSSNWYAISLNTTDTNTLGDLAYHFSSGTDPQLCDQVVVDLPGNVQNIGGQAVALDANNYLKVDVVDWAGTAVAAPNTAGYPLVDVGKINNVDTTSVTAVNANQGTTQSVNFTGTAGSALVKGDTVDIAGSAVNASSAQLGVNVVNFAGQAAALDSNNYPKVSAYAIAGDTAAAANLAASADVIWKGSVTSSPSATTFIDSTLTQADTNFWVNRQIIMTSGTQKYQIAAITGFNHTTHQLTFATMTTAVQVGDTYVII